MTTRNAALVLLVSLSAMLLCCKSNDPWRWCTCKDPSGNASIVYQDGPCENQPMGSGVTCVPLSAESAGVDGGTGGGGGAGGGH
jgi:hypothetical protein